MRQWNFYFSGIRYGILEERASQDGACVIRSRALDPFTSDFRTAEVLKDDSFYGILCQRSIKSFFNNLYEYEALLASAPEHAASGTGECFKRREDGSYIQRHVKFPLDLYLKGGKIYAALMTGRDYTAALVLDGWEDKTILERWNRLYPFPVFRVTPPMTCAVATRDGERLAADVYLPAEVTERVPAVLVRTPYGKRAGCQQYYRFVQRGYAVVIQDVRGREDSSGEWLPNYYEVEDGDDTLDWIAAQPWSDGRVGMTGGSYLGYVQWSAAASGNPHLKAILSSVCAGSAFVDLPRRGGCFTSGMLAWAFAMSEQHMRGDLMVQDDWDEILKLRPVRDIPRKALGHDVPFLRTWLERKDYDDLWKRSNWKDRSRGNVVPAFIQSGWFDDNGMGTTEALDLVKQYYPRGAYKVILGPWTHSGNANYDLHHQYMGDHALRYDLDLLSLQWLDHFLKGVDNGIENTAPVEYYTLGENRWKTSTSWPVSQAVPVDCYLDAADDGLTGSADDGLTGSADDGLTGSAGGGLTGSADDGLTGSTDGGLTGSAGDPGRSTAGILTFSMPQSGSCLSYDYDPAHPAAHIIDMSENELEVPEDYTEEEKRPDILTYTTPVLTEDLTVTGDILSTLYVSSDCPDTDFVIRVTDVDPQGTSIKLADGVICARYRGGFEHPQFMEAGQVYELQIRTTKISNTFRAGHRLRLSITSSAENFIFPNSNTEDGFDSETTRIAHNTVHHGGLYPSRIRLMVER